MAGVPAPALCNNRGKFAARGRAYPGPRRRLSLFSSAGRPSRVPAECPAAALHTQVSRPEPSWKGIRDCATESSKRGRAGSGEGAKVAGEPSFRTARSCLDRKRLPPGGGAAGACARCPCSGVGGRLSRSHSTGSPAWMPLLEPRGAESAPRALPSPRPENAL